MSIQFIYLFYFISFAIQIGQKEIIYNNSVYTLNNLKKNQKQIQEKVRKHGMVLQFNFSFKPTCVLSNVLGPLNKPADAHFESPFASRVPHDLNNVHYQRGGNARFSDWKCL